MKVFITGSTGLLGSALLRNSPKGTLLAASYNKIKYVPNVNCIFFPVDITKKALVNKVIKEFSPDVIIHTAAIATPDYCDKHRSEAKSVNVNGTKNVIEASQAVNASLVYITTNGIFDGNNPPYNEDALPKPVDFYGETKYEAERLVRSSKIKYIVIRLITMYGWNNPLERQNPLTWLLEILGRNKTPVNMVNDMYNNFLSVESASYAIWETVLKKYLGETFNIAGKNCISRYDFSLEIARVFSLDEKMIYPVSLSFFKNFVSRPLNTCFNTKKMESYLNTKPLSVKKGLLYLKAHPLSDYAWKEIL